MGAADGRRVAEDALLLAWRASRRGRAQLRDTLLTLAVARSGPSQAVWAERLRRHLGRTRPGHPFGRCPTVGAALADPKLAQLLIDLDRALPPERLRALVHRAEPPGGPHAPRRSPGQIVEALMKSGGLTTETQRHREE